MLRIICMHRNAATGRFHPFLYRMAPLPSDDHTPGATVRFKSSAHHTEGFTTLEQAQAFAERDMLPAMQQRGPVTLRLDDVYEDTWENHEVPATVRFFPSSELP